MAGGKTDKSSKRKPSMEKGMHKNTVATGKGAPLASDGSGSNKAAKALSSTGIKAGAPVKKGMVQNDGHDSAIGKVRPTQDGGPRTGQTSGVDFNVRGKTTSKDWGWTVK